MFSTKMERGIMKNLNDKELSPCIVSWAKFALNIKLNRPTNSKKCSLTYWQDVINTILSKEGYQAYIGNRQQAIQRYNFVSPL